MQRFSQWIIRWGARITFLLIVSILSTGQAFALAGLSERDSTLHYNAYANIDWGYPSDVCTPIVGAFGDQYCFHLLFLSNGEQSRYGWGDLQVINIPSAWDVPWVLAQNRVDHEWMIFNIQTRELDSVTYSYQEALKKWTSMGLTEPEFANAANLSKYFEETEQSKQKHKDTVNYSLTGFAISLWLILRLLLGLSPVLFIIVSLMVGVFVWFLCELFVVQRKSIHNS
jgi:hypothetical protein